MAPLRCPCLTGLPYNECCGPLHSGTTAAATAEQLMRSRYSAYAIGNADYLLKSWHPDTRPGELALDPDMRWYRLDILATEQGRLLDREGTVEFRAHYRTPDGPGEQHEVSRFTKHSGTWVYVDAV